MNLNPYLDISPEVRAALDAGKPVVGLESTIISHGMPYPKNVVYMITDLTQVLTATSL